MLQKFSFFFYSDRVMFRIQIVASFNGVIFEITVPASEVDLI